MKHSAGFPLHHWELRLSDRDASDQSVLREAGENDGILPLTLSSHPPPPSFICLLLEINGNFIGSRGETTAAELQLHTFTQRLKSVLLNELFNLFSPASFCPHSSASSFISLSLSRERALFLTPGNLLRPLRCRLALLWRQDAAERPRSAGSASV